MMGRVVKRTGKVTYFRYAYLIKDEETFSNKQNYYNIPLEQ